MKGRSNPLTDQLNQGLIKFMSEYNVLITAVVAIGVLTGILAFIYLLTRLAASADNPKERGEILKELLIVGVVTSLLGAFSFIVGFYYSIMLNG